MVEHDPDGFCWLDQMQSGNRAEVGDKAFYLGRLKQQGFPVLPGFVVTATVFRRFLSKINWLEPLFADLSESSLHLDVDDPQQLQAIAQRIQQAVQRCDLWDDWLPKLAAQARGLDSPIVLLRPSLGVQVAPESLIDGRITGLLAAQVCQNQPAAIALALRQVWSELFRARSLFFWQRSGVQLHQINLAVLVQPMVGAIASGDAHLMDGMLHLRAIRGLGLGLTRGEVQPDFYQMEATHQTIQSSQVGRKRHAYRLVSGTPDRSAARLPQVDQSDFYQIDDLTDAEAQQPALNPDQLQQTAALVRQVALALGTPLGAEWIWWEPATGGAAVLCLTQIELPLPHSFQPAWQDHQQPAALRDSSFPPPPASSSPAASLPLDAIAGIAAAPGQVFGTLWKLPDDPQIPVPAGVILLIDSLSPQWAAQLGAIAGIIAEQGGLTSHAAILARELGIPAVVGASGATRRLSPGSVVWLDGDRGTIYLLAPETPVPSSPAPRALAASVSPPATATGLLLNLGRPDNLLSLSQLPVDGVGLLRSEHLLMDGLAGFGHPPDRTALVRFIVQRVQPIVAAFAPRPVFYRTLDWRSHEFRKFPAVAEPNPLLGVHGTFGDRLQPHWFDAQLEALRGLQRAGFTNLRLLLPFVRTVEEFQFCRERVQRAGLMQVPEFQLWIMAEVPSVLFLLPDFVLAGLQGISIGSNDLTQLLLAVDRDNPQIAEAYDDAHPAVMRAIQHLIRTAQQQGIPCSICGEAPTHHPELVSTLVEWGISTISVGPSAVDRVLRAIAQAERSLLLNAARQTLQAPPTPE